MPRVWLSLGSNRQRETSIRGALAALRARFGELVVSSVYESAAVGFTGSPFYNLVVGMETGLPPAELEAIFHRIEADLGRTRDGPRFGPRTLDIDLLTYGDLVTTEGAHPLPREDILEYPFVLGPLAEVAPGERHPVTGRTYEELWAAWPEAGHRALRRVSMALT